jgi:uncharacterized protein
MTASFVHRLLIALVLLPVKLYRVVLSPMKRGPSCRYLPTCSEYAIEAVQIRGVVVGMALAIGRVLRCNPLFHAGHDPVPSRRDRCQTPTGRAGGVSSDHCREQH